MSPPTNNSDTPTEAIRRGIFVGLEALEWLQRHGDYVFHGSRRPYSILQPRQAHSFDPDLGKPVDDGVPAVCASPTPEAAVFMALIKPVAEDLTSERCALIYRDGSYEYRATPRLVQEAQSRTGYVHAIRTSSMRPWQGDEYRTGTAVRPDYVVAVTGNDLRVKITMLTRH